MSLLNSAAAKLSAYNRDSVLSASPARLLTMLYDRLALDLTRAEEALHAQNWPTAWENLRHADQIVAELASTLRVDLWDGAEGLLQLYGYLAELIVAGTVDHDAAKVSNVTQRMVFSRGDVEKGFAEADFVMERTYRAQWVHQGYLEPMAATVDYDTSNGEWRVWTSTQGDFTTRDPTRTEPWATLLAENSAGATAFDAPLFLAQGLDDELVVPSDTTEFAAHESSLGIDVTYHEIPFADHGTVAYLALPALLRWLDGVASG